MRRSILALTVLALLATVPSLANPRPGNCVRCGNEFNGVQPSSCGLLIAPVDGYRANGDFIARFDNRCFACTLDTKTHCTVDVNTQASAEGETPLEDLIVEADPGQAEPAFVEPCNRGQCTKDYGECLDFCSTNLCIIDCETRLQICLDQCG